MLQHYSEGGDHSNCPERWCTCKHDPTVPPLDKLLPTPGQKKRKDTESRHSRGRPGECSREIKAMLQHCSEGEDHSNWPERWCTINITQTYYQ